MGRVFTYKQIKQRHIPILGDFPVALQVIRQALESHPGVVAGLQCGSVLEGTHNPRSDVDVVVVYQQANFQNVMEDLQRLTAFAWRLHIPVQFIPFSLEAAKVGLHTVSLGFGYHLMHASKHGGIIKSCPISLFKVDANRNKDQVRDYLIHKQEKLMAGLLKMPSMGQSELCRFLQKALEAPVHVARKMLQVKAEMLDYPKKVVWNCYPSRLHIDARRVNLFLRCMEMDGRYSAELNRQVQEPNPASYAAMLGALKALVSDVHEFVEMNLNALD